MKIAIDASRAINEKAGIGRYTLELVKKLVEIDQKNTYLLFFSFWRKDNQKQTIIRAFEKIPNVEVKTFRLPGQVKEKIWGWRVKWFDRFLLDVDIFWAPTFLDVNLGLNVPQVVTIYDLTHFLFPEHLGKKMSDFFNKKTSEACQKAQKIIAISWATKKDLEKHFKIPSKKIQVIYPGKNELPQPAKNLPASLKKNSFILSVGTIEPRKNLINLFKAYALLPRQLQQQYPLAIAGAKGWNENDTLNTFDQLGLKDKVKFLGYVSDSTLAKLYQDAAIFCYPSLYEGFGFPVLEALSYGLPVITSNSSSLPEVAGNQAVYIDPNDPKSISHQLQRLLEHEQQRRELKKNAKMQAQKFSWDKTARETLKIFEEVNKSHE